MLTTSTAQRALSAYGGEARWRDASAVEAVFTVGGLMFLWKRGRGFKNLHFRAEIGQPRARFYPIDRDGNVGVMDGHDVRIETPDGRVLAARSNARSHFRTLRHWLHWDALDMTYFTGYAEWNYLQLPALLLRDDIEWRDLRQGTLGARMPSHLPTHTEFQQFHFDPDSGLLRQHDFNVDVLGTSRATAARVVLRHEVSDGIPFAKKQHTMTRSADGRAISPLMVWIDMHEWHLV